MASPLPPIVKDRADQSQDITQVLTPTSLAHDEFPVFQSHKKDDLDSKTLNVLKHGQIRYPQEDSTCDYVFVPNGFNFDRNSLEEIADALKWQLPMLFFTFPVNNFEAFNIGEESIHKKFNFIPSDFGLQVNDWEAMTSSEVSEKRKVMIDKIIHLLRVLAAAASQQNSWLVMETANYYDGVSRILSHSLRDQNDANLLGLVDFEEFGAAKENEVPKSAILEQVVKHAVALDQDVDQVLELNIPPPPQTGNLSPDQAPYRFCPNPIYEKLVIFEHASTRNDFVSALRNIAYEGFVSLAGGVNTFVKVENYMFRGLPLFIVDCSGGASSVAARMVRFMEEKVLPTNTQVDDKMLADFETQVDEIEHVHSARIRMQNWPDNYRREAVLVIEPLRESPSQLLDKITKAMSSVFDFVPELGAKASENVRLQHAYLTARLFEYNAERQGWRANVLQGLVIAAGFLTTVVATLYVYFDDIRSNTSSGIISLLYTLNVVLPAIGALSLTMDSQFNPIGNWASLLYSAKQLESEIYRYRCRSGAYNIGGKGMISNHTAGQSDSRNEGSKSRRGLNNKTNTASSSSIGGKKSNSNNQSSSSNDSSDSQGFLTMGAMDVSTPAALFASKQNVIWATAVERGSLEQPPARYVTPRNRPKRMQALSELTTVFKPANIGRVHPASDQGAGTVVVGTTGGGTVYNEGSLLQSQSHNKPRIGPGDVSALSVEEYLQDRLIPLLVDYRASAPRLERQVQILQLLVFISSSVAVVLAAFGLNIWLPIVIAFGGAVSSILHYNQLPNRLANVNAAISELTRVLNWWSGLSLIQRRLPALKTLLVESCENAADAELSSWLIAVKSVNKQEIDEQNKDIEKDDKR